eukprot:NODE_2722_length_480_cov_225.373550_g2145_i0.p1 GENE.NODE_2722_length_480_cov_225.373550_g2145_i0~~NODE_2722_length_480_cov_225.373550_g2145_i0.p1  ORF type:complete len:124 (-),score=58.32 NODE_2722_length_480_cov_225.373550_g2145_i0:108-425(-)
MGGNAGKLLKGIDKDGKNTTKEIDKLFKIYDKDKSGTLTGSEYEKFLDDATKYMLNDLNSSGHKYDYSTIHGWIKMWIDKNGDGRIDRAELHANLKAVLDAGEKM